MVWSVSWVSMGSVAGHSDLRAKADPWARSPRRFRDLQQIRRRRKLPPTHSGAPLGGARHFLWSDRHDGFIRLHPPGHLALEHSQCGRCANINRPIAGPTHEKALPVGRHPLQLYSQGTPNGQKVTVLLEELLALGHAGAEYDAWLIPIQEGAQFGSGFVEVNPNSKIPALMDHSGPEPIRVFESGAILMHLAEKFGAFLPPVSEPARRAECLSWLFWQMGSAPFLGGGFGHFYAYAPIKIEYAIDRYAMEVKRQLDVLNRHLATHTYL